MPVLKLSEITAASSGFVTGDQIVSVKSGAIDALLSKAQLFAPPIVITDIADPATSTLTLTGATALTTSQPVLNMTQTWNSAALFTGMKLTITDTNSNGLAIAFDIFTGVIGTLNIFRVYKTGDVKCYSVGDIAGGWLFTSSVLRASNTSTIEWNTRAILTSPAAATMQFGNVDAAAPVAQTLQAQSVVAGTSNTAGVDWTLTGSRGTGTGKGGNIIFQVAPCSSGTGATAQNPVQTGLSIIASSVSAFTQQPSVVVGSSQLGSSAVEGFLYIPTVNGPPTGAPTTYAGRVPLVFDSSNNRLYIYNSSGATWVGGTAPGTWS